MRFVILAIFHLLLISASVQAEGIGVFKRNGYERLVVPDGGALVVTESPETLTIKSQKKESWEALSSTSQAIDSIQQDGQNYIISKNPGVSDTRHFQIGNRLIIDFFLDKSKIVATKPAQETKTETQPKQEAADIPPAKSVQTQDDVPAITQNDDSTLADELIDRSILATFDEIMAMPVDVTEVAAVVDHDAETHEQDQKELVAVDEAAPEDDKLVVDRGVTQPTIVTLSASTAFDLAIFQRYNRLFLITSHDDIALPPRIEGAGAAANWPVTEVAILGGSAWMINIPPHAYLRPEGGGLVWRVIISDQDLELSSAELTRNVENTSNPNVRIGMENSEKLLRFHDPDYSDDLAVVTAKKATHRMLKSYDFVDFDVLPAVVGAVIKPQADGVRVAVTKDDIQIEKRDGLIVASEPQDDVVTAYLSTEEGVSVKSIRRISSNRIFFFDAWGANLPISEMLEKRQTLEDHLLNAEGVDKIEAAIETAKFFLSKGMGQEAIGYLNIAKGLNGDLANAPDYKALAGVAYFMARQYDKALAMFEDSQLVTNGEALLWHAATLGYLDRSKDALEIYNNNADVALTYPMPIRMRLIPPIVRSFIEQSDAETALKITEIIDVEDKSDLTSEDFATIAYLKGRAQKMAGYPEKAMESLYKASLTDKLGPYGIQSELMLIEDELKREKITKDEAILRMERLRFAWRGDELEDQIYNKLGALYIDANKPRQGLNILKRAAKHANNVTERRAIVRKMAEAYRDIFIGERFDELDPVEAITVYDEFKELTPVGDEGNALIDRLADKLMDIGLMSRAVSVLQDKVERLEGGKDAIKTGLRIAAIQLLDRQPEATLETLTNVDSMVFKYSGDDKDMFNEKIVMLKARALSDTGQANKALFMMEGLPDTDEILRLRVDTAWKAGEWLAVSDSLDKLIAREDLSSFAPLTKEQTQMLLNQGLALSLSEQYSALERFADRYDSVMKQSPVYKTFRMITRPAGTPNLADRETLLNLTSEVDLFGNVLNEEKKPNPTEQAQ